MGMKISSDVGTLMTMITQGGDRAVRGVSAQMKIEGEKIAELAKEYAPVDEGSLEESIRVESDRSGVNGRTQVYVYIDENHPAAKGGVVGRYAMRMHEGSYNLGPGSRAKDRGRGVVGPKFLERAADERAEEVVPHLIAAAKRALA